MKLEEHPAEEALWGAIWGTEVLKPQLNRWTGANARRCPCKTRKVSRRCPHCGWGLCRACAAQADTCRECGQPIRPAARPR